MTAIVGVLNKHAVAIAADSAVTMGNTHKVVNSANKIFTLSKYCPVAVMTYSSASFMGVPWDIIIKEYRKQLKNKCFPKLENYVNDFMDYLHNKQFFCDVKTQNNYLNWMLESFFDICCEEICYENHIADKATLSPALIEQKLKDCIDLYKSAEKCPDFVVYTLKDFKNYTDIIIQDFAKKNGNLFLRKKRPPTKAAGGRITGPVNDQRIERGTPWYGGFVDAQRYRPRCPLRR